MNYKDLYRFGENEAFMTIERLPANRKECVNCYYLKREIFIGESILYNCSHVGQNPGSDECPTKKKGVNSDRNR